MPLIAFHLVAASELIKHREELLEEEDVPAPSSVALSFTFIITMIYLIIFHIVYRYKRKQFFLREYVMHCLTSLSIAYLGHLFLLFHWHSFKIH